jgi:hypothetical protein
MSFAKIIVSRMKKPPMDMGMDTVADMMPLPTIGIDSKDYSEVKDWKVGQKYSIEFKMISRTEEADGDVMGRFELVAEKGAEKPGSDTKES